MKTSDIRREYQYGELHRRDLAADPFAQFSRWLDEAVLEPNLPDPTAMTLATVNAQGQPAQRTVLLKDHGAAGFTFFTNLRSHKAQDLQTNAKVSLLFPWLVQSRQVIIQGTAQRTTRAEDEAYFSSRPRGSQLAAWASEQSSVLQNREQLEAAFADMENRFGDGRIPCPEHWGGWRVIPARIEFWQGRPSRLHDRFVYEKQGNAWRVFRLAP
ncbi:MAG: pyridoxamine 5'-phosphate oxidase [Cellvibrionales bacterium]|jgi:pyridoxamine 5'-phosphate oxidase|nr:pyridoxamine 5'-phosphate oxidase [Cellvibrionales bacterium]MBK8675711.1 pyridoxamine 5'-phosphate oxidase [Cellvibrionales bacterium]HRF87656.1 pyridoxamine 5'-phosphate oxidase [Pseudomonadales bacterium]HRG51022.1 pyridoxamine 5'-phosphate oxidase [Pseudomonadales bacterium]